MPEVSSAATLPKKTLLSTDEINDQTQVKSPFLKSIDYMEEDEKEEKEVGTLKIPSRLIFLFNY